MPYPEQNKAEKAALAEIKKVIKGKGKRKGVFYIATNSGAEKGQQASVVVNSFSKDKKGGKTLSAGKKMKKGLGATATMRGLVEVSGSSVVLSVLSKKGNARLMKKLLWQDLAERAKGGSKAFDPSTAKSLLLIFKKCKIQDGTDSPDDALDAEEHGEEVEASLSPEDFVALGIDPDEAAELGVLEAHFAAKMDEMTDALGDILGEDDADDDHDDEMLQKAALAELNELKTKLASYDSMSAADKTAVLEKIQTQIDLIGEKSSGENPFPDEIGGVIPATEAILLDVAKATESYLIGDRTMGMETEYVRAPTVSQVPWKAACPTCKVKAHKVCLKSNKTEKFIGAYHKSRADKGKINDHTTVFLLTRKSDGKKLCSWDFETQGKPPRYYGTLEAVTEPWTMKAPDDPEEARLHKLTTDEILKAIDLVQSKRKSQIATGALVSAVSGGLGDTVTFAKAGSCPGDLLFRKSPGRAPQITFSTSLAGFQETCKAGFPEGIHGDSRMKMNNFQLKAAALDGDDLYNAVVGAISEDSGGDQAHRDALASGKIGPKLKGFSTVVAAWAASLALWPNAVDAAQDGWHKSKIMPHPSMMDPPQGESEDDSAFKARMEKAAVEKTFYWGKDMFAIMPKVPMPYLAQDGGLTAEELALCQAKEDEFIDAVGVVLGRYGVTLDQDADTGESIEDFLRDSVLNGKPSSPDDMAAWKDEMSSKWSSTTGSAEGHEITHRDDDESLRMVTEVRMCSGKNTSEDIVKRMAQKLAEADQGLVEGALSKVFI